MNRSYETVEIDLNLFPEKIINNIDKYGIFDLKNNSLFVYAADHGISGKWGLSEQGLKAPFIDSNFGIHLLDHLEYLHIQI